MTLLTGTRILSCCWRRNVGCMVVVVEHAQAIHNTRINILKSSLPSNSVLGFFVDRCHRIPFIPTFARSPQASMFSVMWQMTMPSSVGFSGLHEDLIATLSTVQGTTTRYRRQQSRCRYAFPYSTILTECNHVDHKPETKRLTIQCRATNLSEPSKSLQKHRNKTDQFLNGSDWELETPSGTMAVRKWGGETDTRRYNAKRRHWRKTRIGI